jgi:predicted Kef-type K+ transport protein
MLEPWLLNTVWISLAFLGGFLARRINLPPLIGFLVAGFVLNYFDITEGSQAMEVAASLGVMLLLFTIGLKLNVRDLLEKVIWMGTSLQMIIMTILSGGLVLLLSVTGIHLFTDISLPTALLIGFALSFSSTVFAIKILEERGEVNAFHGKVAIGILIMQDIFAVLFITISKGSLPSLWALALPVFLLVVRYLLFKILDSIDHGELLTLFGLFAAMVAGAASFQVVGLKPDLGALIMGILLGGHPRAKEVATHMMGYKDFFLIAFFFEIGLSGMPTWNSLILALIFVIVIFIKGGVFLGLLTRFNLRSRTAWLSTLSLMNYSEFGLIVAGIGVKNGWIEPEWLVILALTMSLSFIVSSPFNHFAHRLFDKYKNILMKLNTQQAHPDDEPINLGNAEVLLCGMGRVGKVAYEFLTKQYGDKVIGIDYNHEKVRKLEASNINVRWGDSTDSEFWENVHMSKVQMVLLASNDYQTDLNTANELYCIVNKQFQIGALGHYDEEIEALKKAGVDFVYDCYAQLGREFAGEFLEFLQEK